MKRAGFALPFALASAVTSAGEAPADHPYFTSRHSLALGATRQQVDATVRASVADLPEVSVDLDDLGVDDRDDSWMLQYRWRFAERWMMHLSGYTFSAKGARTASRDFNFDGREFEAGVQLDTEFGVDTYIADVMYAVYRGDRAEWMLGGGVHALDLSTGMRTRIFAGEEESEREAASEALLAPLPNLRFQGYYALSARWGVSLVGGWLSANYEDFDGSFTYAHLQSTYYPWGNFGISLGYQYTDVDLTEEKSGGREVEFDVQFSGPTLQLVYSF